VVHTLGEVLRHLNFHSATRDTIREFPKEIRIQLGEALVDLQQGYSLSMPLSRTMPAVAPGVSELRLRDRSGIYRVFYYLKVKGMVLVFHAFQKKTQRTPQSEIETAKKRLKELL
jgi:phage-related protein